MKSGKVMKRKIKAATRRNLTIFVRHSLRLAVVRLLHEEKYFLFTYYLSGFSVFRRTKDQIRPMYRALIRCSLCKSVFRVIRATLTLTVAIKPMSSHPRIHIRIPGCSGSHETTRVKLLWPRMSMYIQEAQDGLIGKYDQPIRNLNSM